MFEIDGFDQENKNHADKEKKGLKDDFDDSATPDELDDSKVKFLSRKEVGLDRPT